jgi:hypothetical protein
MAIGKGWCLCVCGNGIFIVDTDHGADNEKADAYSYVEGRGSLLHQVALGLHGMIMTEDC